MSRNTLDQQLARVREIPVKPGDWRAARRKREACTRLELKLAKREARRYRPDPNWVPPF